MTGAGGITLKLRWTLRTDGQRQPDNAPRGTNAGVGEYYTRGRWMARMHGKNHRDTTSPTWQEAAAKAERRMLADALDVVAVLG